jgi:hypothetical protein
MTLLKKLEEEASYLRSRGKLKEADAKQEQIMLMRRVWVNAYHKQIVEAA